MCTVTVIPIPGGIRVACNRDERHDRAAALVPRVRRFGDNLAAMPIDPVSDGTWVAVSDAGIVMALLNVNQLAKPTDSVLFSRGRIIPTLLHAESFRHAQGLAGRIESDQFHPFRLVIADCHQREPLMFTSSSLGDHLVERPRQALFEQFMSHAMTSLRQDEFHRHRWPDRPHLSVNMIRSDAQTVSYTTIDLTSDHAVLRYFPDGPDSVCRTTHSLKIRSLTLT
jgi:hypothetical protein